MLRKDMSVLTYYASDQASDMRKVLGTILLCEKTTVAKVDDAAEASGKEFVFRIDTPFTASEENAGNDTDIPQSCLLLHADSEGARDNWISEIEYQVSTGRMHKFQNAELGWWDLLFKGRELRTFTKTSRRKGFQDPSTKMVEGQDHAPTLFANAPLTGIDSRLLTTTKDGVLAAHYNDSDYSSSDSDGDADEDAEADEENEEGEGNAKRTPLNSMDAADEGSQPPLSPPLSTSGGAASQKHSCKSGKKHKRILAKTKHKKEKNKSPLAQPFAENIDKFLVDYKSHDNYMELRGSKKHSAKSTVDGRKSPVTNSTESISVVEGIQICLELKHICYENDNIFVVLHGYSHNASDSANKSEELSRSETICVTESADYALSLPICHLHFSLLQANIPKNVNEVYCTVNREEQGNSDNIVTLTEAICSVRFSREVFQTNTIFCSEMVIVNKNQVDLTNPQLVESEAKVGFLRLSSTALQESRLSLCNSMRMRPYSERMFSFKAVNGVIPTLEQLFASPYSIFASKSYIKLLMKERDPVIAKWTKISKNEVLRRVQRNSEKTKNTASHVGLDPNAFVDEWDLMREDEAIDIVHDSHLCDTQDVLDFYKKIMKDTDTDLANIVPAENGGIFLRRSPWKKLARWQYATTNLNLQLFTSDSTTDKELLTAYYFNDLGRKAIANKAKTDGVSDEFDMRASHAASSEDRSHNACISHFSHLRRNKMNTKGFNFNGVDFANENRSSKAVDRSPSQSTKDLQGLQEENEDDDAFRNSSIRERSSSALPVADAEALNENADVSRNALTPSSIKSLKSVADMSASDNNSGDKRISDNIHFIPFITLGVPSAHGLGFSKGGLRKIFADIDDPKRKMMWMHAIQMPDIEPLLELKKHHLADFTRLFGENAVGEEPKHMVELVSRKFAIAKRIDIVSSQIMGFACTLIRTVIILASQQPLSIHAETVRVSLKVGWILTLQSFLSTYGDELGMIEDLECAAVWLRGLKVRLVDASVGQSSGVSRDMDKEKDKDKDKAKKAPSNSTYLPGVHVWRATTGKLVMDLELGDSREVAVIRDALSFWKRESKWHAAKPRTSEQKHLIVEHLSRKDMDLNVADEVLLSENATRMPVLAALDLCGVTFTMGVNEMQTYINQKTRMHVSSRSSVNTQAEINKESMKYVDHYWLLYRDWWSRMYAYQGLDMYGLRTVLATQDLFNNLETAVAVSAEAPDVKNINILTASASFCRKLGGTIGILCKSGKDRTSMSATLEMARAVVDVHNVIDGQEVVDALRSHGCRRMNVWGNTGQPMYAFNSIQRMALPNCYRPPVGTFSGSVNS